MTATQQKQANKTARRSPRPAPGVRRPGDADQRAVGRLFAVLYRADAFMHGYRTFRAAFLWTVVALVVSVGANVALLSTRPEPRYFAVGPDGRLLPMIALNEPYRTEEQVIDYAIKWITRALTLNFAEYRRQLQEAKTGFTRAGWSGENGFKAALIRQRLIDYITERKLIVTARATGPGVVVASGMAGGRWKWRVQFPVTLTFQSASERKTVSWIMDVTVTRVSTLEDPGGIRIEAVRARSGNTRR